MKALIQRVKSSQVEIDSKVHSAIGLGLLIFLGIDKDDTPAKLEKMIQKILDLRIFADEAGKMNLSVLDTKSEVMLVSQFTLSANLNRGKRPSFESAAPRDLALELYGAAIKALEKRVDVVQTGVFGADMQVSLVNDGPVTLHIDL